MFFPIWNAEGSPTAIVPSSTFLNVLACEPRCKKVKYLDPIPDPVEIRKLIINSDI